MRRTSLTALVLAAVVCGGVQAVSTRAAAADTAVVQTTQSRLVVPFDFDAASLAKVGAVAVDLWVSTDGGAFRREASAATSENQFVYQAPRSGQYAFCVRVRDQAGRRIPAGPLEAGMTVRVSSAAQPVAANRPMSLESRSVELVASPPAVEARPQPAMTPAPVVEQPAPQPTVVAASQMPPMPSFASLEAPPAAASIPARSVSLSAAPALRTPAAAQPAPYAVSNPVRQVVQQQVVPTSRFELGYEVDDVGPSGVERVALYISEDDGRNWFLYGTDQDRISPLAVDVPRDGRYGFAFRVTSGVGLVTPPPQPGERPEIDLSVDTQPPEVHLSQATVERDGATQSVQIRWTANDANPSDRPISIDVAAEPSGPWTEIASALPNSGRHTWDTPTGSYPKAYFRVRATDVAGHTAGATSTAAVILDSSRPTARVTAVRPLAN